MNKIEYINRAMELAHDGQELAMLLEPNVPKKHERTLADLIDDLDCLIVVLSDLKGAEKEENYFSRNYENDDEPEEENTEEQ